MAEQTNHGGEFMPPMKSIAFAAEVALNERDPRILRAALRDIYRIATAETGSSET